MEMDGGNSVVNCHNSIKMKETRCSNCNPVNVAESVKLQVQCEGCQKIVWYFESKKDFTGSLSHCHSESVKKPLIQKAEGSSSFTIKSDALRKVKAGYHSGGLW